MSSIRLLTLNLHKGLDLFGRCFVLPQLREAILGEAADVVFLQEVLDRHGKYPDRHADTVQPQHEYIAARRWQASAYGRNAVLKDV
jgi:endonuclease/exonuclease/phosphatase family metal-dependent hydrolase